ncbi:glycosyltransferase [Dokdonia sinensis]|uniref:Glycosyltransferase n=1 Tax=Dokdonia sinensis TaxID=2479847 RepID=A0A3M0FTZ9_9FLAO|nr:glycosyltransferase [Dokdonia sinensis]RMB56131.1 glycosyltransferase [Dokdonia sinensis]
MNLDFSFIVPVFNRPDEIGELLESMTHLKCAFFSFEVVIVEDGSSISCYDQIRKYEDILDITYYKKANSGPGASRNYGMERARGNYFLILDSDCILPSDYLNNVRDELSKSYVDFFGGPDAAMDSFSNIQKAINYAMTSMLTTGGIRGADTRTNSFQPRSFNMGISKQAFQSSKGFGKIHPGEDPDLVLRLWKMGFKSRLFSDAFVYHKRRISWAKFYKQVYKFGLVRPILNTWHKDSSKITYWFPTLFIAGLACSLVLPLFGVFFPIICYCIYFASIFIHALVTTRSIHVTVLTAFAVCIQFFGYGYGFFKSTLFVSWLKSDPKETFPELFFD